jgi:hypothetical protein
MTQAGSSFTHPTILPSSPARTLPFIASQRQLAGTERSLLDRSRLRAISQTPDFKDVEIRRDLEREMQL